MEIFFDSYLGGLVTGAVISLIIGLFGKSAYQWLFRNPSIHANARLQGVSAHPPSAGFREYSYRIIIAVENHSSNDAYYFKISDLTPLDKKILKLEVKVKNGLLINKNQRELFKYEFSITLPVDKHNASHGASERIRDFNNQIEFNVSYKNESGRKFQKHKKVTMETRENTFFAL